MTETDLEDIHSKMKDELKTHSVTIDAIYHCPHGWDEGCFCRKPNPGMLFQAQRDFHLDLTRVCFIGDDIRLEPVILNEDADIDDILSYFMGKNTPQRQDFIIDNLRFEIDEIEGEEEDSATEEAPAEVETMVEAS